MTDSGPQIFSVRQNGQDLRQLTHVAIMNADGSNLRVLSHPDAVFESDPSFTPDGKRLIIDRFDGVSESAVSVKLDGSDPRVIAAASGPDPNLSPNGRSLAFLGFNGEDLGQALMTTSIPGNQQRQLTPFSFDVGFKLDWAPDGRRLAFIHNADFAIEGASANIATVRPDGSDLRFVTHYTGGEVNAFFGSYSPDGSWIVFRLEDHGRYGLYKIRPDGTHLRAILPLSEFAPRFIDWGSRDRRHRDEG